MSTCNATFSPLELGSKIALTTLYIFIIILAVGGNSIVCFIIIRDLKSSITNLFLFNLSMADILMTLFVIPISTSVDIWIGYWPFGILVCKLIPFVQCLTISLISLTHVVISCDRFILVFYTLKKRISRVLAIFVIGLTWFLATAQALPLLVVSTLRNDTDQPSCEENWDRAANTTYTMVLLILQYFLPLAFITSTYIAIMIKVWAHSVPGETDIARDARLAKSKRKMVKMMIVVALMYAISHLPRHVVYLIGYQADWCYSWIHIVWNIVVVLSCSSSCYNPIIYAWMNKSYRLGIARVFAVCLPCIEPPPRLLHRNTANYNSTFRSRQLTLQRRDGGSSANSSACHYKCSIKLHSTSPLQLCERKVALRRLQSDV